MDSTGGVLHTEEKINEGIHVKVENEDLLSFLKQSHTIMIKKTVEDPDNEGMYFVKFEVPDTSSNKKKYIESINKEYQERLTSAGKAS